MTSLCCGSNGAPFVQTQFLGASIVGFSASVDWNGTGGGLQVELAEDICNGDMFNPPGIGSPVYFSYGGFTMGGILQNWRQSNSAEGEKTYTVNVTSPRDLVEGCQVILSSYNGSTMGVPNLVNVYGYLEGSLGASCAESGFVVSPEEYPYFGASLTYPPAPGYGGALNNEVGIPWRLIQWGLSAVLNGAGGAYGSPIQFRGHVYYVDLSELPLLTSDVRLGGENMSLEDLVARVCALGGVDYFYDLITVGAGCIGTTYNIIKLRTSRGSWQAYDQSAKWVDQTCGSHIDARLNMGTIGSTINASSCVHAYGRGLELRLDTTNAFITGEYRQEVWQVAYDGEADGVSDTIWPYWGKNPDGTVMLASGTSDGTISPDTDDTDHWHHFTIKTDHLGIGVETWTVTTAELDAALAGKAEWEAWLVEREPAKFLQVTGLEEQAFHTAITKKKGANGELVDDAFLISNFQRAHDDAKAEDKDPVIINPLDAQAWHRDRMIRLGGVDNFNDQQYHNMGLLFDYIRKYAQEYYGRQFLVKLPFLCRRYNSDTPWTFEANWEPGDSGWTEWPVLGLPNPHWLLDMFRADDGKIKCFMKFQSERPMVLKNVSRSDYFVLDSYNVFVEGTCTEIVWVSPTDARAVVKISGPVQQANPYGVLPEWLLTFFLLSPYHDLTPEEVKTVNKVMRTVGDDTLSLGCEEPPLVPVAVAVPLQSTRLVYGPWFAKSNDFSGFNFFSGGSPFSGSDSGKTEYSRESGFAPWHFGSFARMNAVAYSTAASMLGDKYVVEMGDITFPGAPVGSLGNLIAGGGPAISNIDVRVGRGSGAVLTTYRMKTYTPDMGQLSKHRLSQIRQAGLVAIKAEKMFKKHAMERLRNQSQLRLDQVLLAHETSAGMSGRSSHTLMGGQAGKDVDNDEHARTIMSISDGRQDLRAMRADDDASYRRRAYMSTIGMFRPFSTLPEAQKDAQDDAAFLPHWRDEINRDVILEHGLGEPKIHEHSGCPTGENEYFTNNVDYFSHEQVPPIFCKEHHLPINVTSLSPFLSKGRTLIPGWSNDGVCMTGDPDDCKGHDIEYIARDGVYPAHLCIRHPSDNYSSQHWYRGVALRGPLILAGWGYDIDNKPVPNAAEDYPNSPQMKFKDDWLRKPHTWQCGPVDLRWDYKRQVWTAPTPMKIVKLELNEHLCPQGSANAILYEDQEQYGYDGNPVAQEGDCTKQGYKVKVFSNAMYPVPKGWRITAFFDTSLNRYQMLGHDPLPLVQATLDEDMLCLDDQVEATITEVPGGCNLDPCEALVGMKVIITNNLAQPLCAGRSVFVWLCGFQCRGLGEPGPTLHNCEEPSRLNNPDEVKALGVVVQAMFEPECVVTHLELLEYYCWGYDTSCDYDDVQLYSQGDVELCWSWEMQTDGRACLTGVTDGETACSGCSCCSGEHTHTITEQEVNFCGDVSFDLDIDGRFVPGSCYLRVSVLNKNFWEYYWYDLCICTRAIWTQTEMGKATCKLNTMPTCNDDCRDIDCEDGPNYNCDELAASSSRRSYGRTGDNVEEVSWFGEASDTTLITLETSCDHWPPDPCEVLAQASTPLIPSPCSGGCDGTIHSDSGETTPDEAIDHNNADFTDTCADYTDTFFEPFTRNDRANDGVYGVDD